MSVAVKSPLNAQLKKNVALRDPAAAARGRLARERHAESRSRRMAVRGLYGMVVFPRVRTDEEGFALVAGGLMLQLRRQA
jgi:hypothetical protein